VYSQLDRGLFNDQGALMAVTCLLLTLLALGSATMHIRAEYLGPQYHIYLFKPLTMVFILLIAMAKARKSRVFYAYAIVGGLLCSMAGDIFLMLPSDQFIPGLVSFLAAHLCYIGAFTRGRRLRFSVWPILPFVVYGIFIFIFLFPGLKAMKLPVLAYIVVILVMGWQAWERWDVTGQRLALLAFFGAALFIISDTALAINRFRQPFEMAKALILSTYFAAQWMIAFSVNETSLLEG
jgi:uncharacterized membrane protein YhhN